MINLLIGLAIGLTGLGNAGAVPVKEFSLPQHAQQVTDNTFYLGSARDNTSQKMVEGYAIVHKERGHAKGGNKGGGNGGSTCYGFFASGAKWKSPEQWLMNATNNQGLNNSEIFGLTDNGINKWETAANRTGVFGSGSQTNSPLEADTSAPDNQNEVYFGSIDEPGAIAVTIVWGIFGGPPQGRQLVEWDMIFDQVDFDWATNGASNKMDFDNIATHELGHAAGLVDLYTNACSEETMFGYAEDGETKKRDLATGDTIGIERLYR